MSESAVPRPVSSTIVPPDPSITSAIGRHHTLHTAVADLVDNSIDAGATQVLVRFLIDNTRPVGLQIIDNGAGMDAAIIDDAMTYARRRRYDQSDLGHFGIGLKAASLSQANTLIVWSRRDGSRPEGRRLRRESIDSGPVVEVFSSEDAANRLDAADVDFPLATGTVVEWQDVQGFLTASTVADQKAWTTRTTQDLLNHLGLVLHRILARGKLTLRIENYDIGVLLPGIRRTVRPIDPFNYRGTRRGNYPKELPIRLGSFTRAAVLHIWPHQDRSPGFAVGGRSELESQGLYIYRKDRLLQAGGWNGLASAHVDLRYARVAIDVTPEMESHISINPEKAGATFDDDIRDAFRGARASDGTTLDSFYDDSRNQARESRQRLASPIQAPRPGSGLPVTVKEVFALHTEPNDASAIDVKWRPLPDGQVYRLDRELHALVLNAKYRSVIAPAQEPEEDDAALVKALLLLLLGEHVDGSRAGPKKKRESAAWQEILYAAIRAQSTSTEQE